MDYEIIVLEQLDETRRPCSPRESQAADPFVV
jgi:hypothetical protein